jgi:hypothetical protein
LTFPQKTVVAAVSNGTGNLDLFACDVQDGHGVPYTASNHGAAGWGAGAWGQLPTLLDPVGPLVLPAGSAFAGASAEVGSMDIFVVDNSQTLCHASQNTSSPAWSDWAAVVQGATFPVGTRPAVVTPGSDAIQLIAVGTDGHVWTAWSQFGGGWNGWTRIGAS